nr:uncharacterized protein I303_03359 [Kwoniella dejecticola CBS 10117]OBR85648.1 hypothetical protein I303_03359 [Kwoniella dejecticola CBS 10117]
MQEMRERLARLESLLERQTQLLPTVIPIAPEPGDLAAPSTSTPQSHPTAVQSAGQPDEFVCSDLLVQQTPSEDISLQPSTSDIRGSHHNRGPARYSEIALSSSQLDRLKPTSGNGPSVQYGATSIWTHDHYEERALNPEATPTSRGSELLPGEYVNWSQNLPPTLVSVMNKSIHDRAIDHFIAYYASWCMVLDSEHFKRDLVICNISSINSDPLASSSPTSPRWTSHYSPFLHNVVLWLGLHHNREMWPEAYAVFTECLVEHCTKLMRAEFDKAPLSALRAVNLFGTCLAQPPKGSHDFGYTYYGMTVAMIQVLGLNINCEAYVLQGRMTQAELDSRNAAYWAAYMYDLLRSISAGRNPMISTPHPDIHLPSIIAETDNAPWYMSASAIGQETRLGHTLNGVKSMRSTSFHWTARLGCLLSKVVHALYSTKVEINTSKDSVVHQISGDLDRWYTEQPFPDPKTLPLPHIILSHMLYHLTRIFLFRPFYRSTFDNSASRMSPSPAEQCDGASRSILELLKLYDTYHGVRYGIGTFVNVTFTSATIFLLKAVEDQSDPSVSAQTNKESSKNIEEITYYMSQLAITFVEAGRGLNILRSLCSEWLHTLNENSSTNTVTHDTTRNLQAQSQSQSHFSSNANANASTGTDTLAQGQGQGPGEFEIPGLGPGAGGNGMTNMGYQNFLNDFPIDEDFYNALLSFVGGT